MTSSTPSEGWGPVGNGCAGLGEGAGRVAGERWARVPWRVRLLVGTASGIFLYGAVIHLVQLLRAGAYPGVPPLIAAFFSSLVVLDPVVAALLGFRRREGLLLGCLVLWADAMANGYANYVVDTAEGITPGRVGQATTTLLAVALVAATPTIRPWLVPEKRMLPPDRAP